MRPNAYHVVSVASNRIPGKPPVRVETWEAFVSTPRDAAKEATKLTRRAFDIVETKVYKPQASGGALVMQCVRSINTRSERARGRVKRSFAKCFIVEPSFKRALQKRKTKKR